MRETDVAARIGGEEFACLLPSSDEAGAHGLAERIRVDLARRAIPLPDGREVTVTASLGIAAYPEGKTAEGLLRAADRALYRAKAEGKNRVASNGGARMKIQLSWTKSVLFVATAATSAYLWGQVLQPQVAQIAAPPPRSLPTTPHVVAPVVRPRVVRPARPRAAVRSVPVRSAPQGTATLVSQPVVVAQTTPAAGAHRPVSPRPAPAPARPPRPHRPRRRLPPRPRLRRRPPRRLRRPPRLPLPTPAPTPAPTPTPLGLRPSPRPSASRRRARRRPCSHPGLPSPRTRRPRPLLLRSTGLRITTTATTTSTTTATTAAAAPISSATATAPAPATTRITGTASRTP